MLRKSLEVPDLVPKERDLVTQSGDQLVPFGDQLVPFGELIVPFGKLFPEASDLVAKRGILRLRRGVGADPVLCPRITYAPLESEDDSGGNPQIEKSRRMPENGRKRGTCRDNETPTRSALAREVAPLTPVPPMHSARCRGGNNLHIHTLGPARQ